MRPVKIVVYSMAHEHTWVMAWHHWVTDICQLNNPFFVFGRVEFSLRPKSYQCLLIVMTMLMLVIQDRGSCQIDDIMSSMYWSSPVQTAFLFPALRILWLDQQVFFIFKWTSCWQSCFSEVLWETEAVWGGHPSHPRDYFSSLLEWGVCCWRERAILKASVTRLFSSRLLRKCCTVRRDMPHGWTKKGTKRDTHSHFLSCAARDNGHLVSFKVLTHVANNVGKQSNRYLHQKKINQ